MNRIVVRVPATTANLGPGFDCLGLALDLFNHVTLDVGSRPAEPRVVIRGEGRERLPRTGRNLALRAAQRVLRSVSRELFVSAVTLDNAIPVGSGLGSSAAAIAGAIVAANAAAGNPLDAAALLRLALEFEPHPDNLAPALYGGFTLAVLAGPSEPLVLALPPPAGLSAVVLTPNLTVSTHQSRATLPASVALADAAFNVGRAGLLAAALVAGRYEMLSTAMEDRLHQPYRAASYAAMPAIISAAVQAGARGAALSGSGPSILALCDGDQEAVSAAMSAASGAHGLGSKVRLLHIISEGAQVVSRSR